MDSSNAVVSQTALVKLGGSQNKAKMYGSEKRTSLPPLCWD